VHVAIADVSEDAAHEEEVGGDGIRVDVAQGRVGANHFDGVELRGDGSLSGAVGKRRIELDQPSTHLPRAWMLGEHIEQVAPIARAEANHARRSRRAAFEEGMDVPPDDLQALRQWRFRISVRVMPVDPVGEP